MTIVVRCVLQCLVEVFYDSSRRKKIKSHGDRLSYDPAHRGRAAGEGGLKSERTIPCTIYMINRFNRRKVCWVNYRPVAIISAVNSCNMSILYVVDILSIASTDHISSRV